MTDHQVLEFTLNDGQYCAGIEHVSEIVRRSEDDMSSLPNTPPHVEGVMDLRGETTTIIEPRSVLSLETTKGNHDKIIVFESDASDDDSVGWAVRDVTRVLSIDTDDIEEVEEESIKGIINRDDGFLFWTSPEFINSSIQAQNKSPSASATNS